MKPGSGYLRRRWTFRLQRQLSGPVAARCSLACFSCCLALWPAGTPCVAAGPEVIGGDGSDPSHEESFQRGQAIALTPGAGFVVFPIPISNPTVGTGLGIASGVLYQMDAKSAPSYTGIGGLATSNGTWGAAALQYFSLDEDRYRLTAPAKRRATAAHRFRSGRTAFSRIPGQKCASPTISMSACSTG